MRAHNGRIRALLRENHLTQALLFAAVLLFSAGTARAQNAQPGQTAPAPARDYSANPNWFPRFWTAYRRERVPPADLANSKSLTDHIHNGKIELSLAQFAAAVVENNLNIATARYDNYFAQADLLRAKSGQAARGIQSAGAGIPDALFSTTIGSGVGGVGGLAANVGSIGSISGSTKSLTLQPRGAFDPAFLMGFSWDHTSNPLNTIVVAGAPVVATNTAFFDFGYQQALPTGTSFSVELANERQNSTQLSLVYNPFVVTRLSFTAVQQLTNGFGTAVNRKFQTVARNNVEITRQWFLQQVDTTLAEAEDSYWNLVSAQEQVKATQEALDAAQRLYENNKMQEEAGTLAPLDVITAQSQVASSQRDVVIAQTNLQQQELTLKNLFSKQLTDVVGDAEIVATDPLPQPQEADIPPLQEAIATAARNRPEVPQAEKSVLNDQLAVKVSENALKPTFNIFGLVASGGLFGNQLVTAPGGLVTLPGGFTQEFNQVIHFRSPEYAFGFDLSIPLKNRSAQADNVRARLLERQAEIGLQGTENQVGVEVRSARINLMQTKSQVEAAVAAVNLSRQTLDAEQKKFAAGLSTPYNIILDQRNVLQSELAEAQARAAYANALVEMQRSMGVIMEKSNISPEDAVRGGIDR